MAAMTTVLTEFAQNGNSRTSTLSTHLAGKPRLVIEKRVVPDGNKTMIDYAFKVVYSTVDAAGTILTQKIAMEAVVRYPLACIAGDLAAALDIFRDIVAGDEFANSVSTQEWL
jgi:hypothetical protein